MSGDGADDLALIVAAAREAGERAVALHAAGLRVSSKPGGSPVTNADLDIDAFLTDRLCAARPDYGWMSEETADHPARLSAARTFVVDPIDGTRAYLKGQPWYAVSIAVVEGGRSTAGVVHAPALGRTFAAVAGGGATANGAAIRASAAERLEDAAMVGDPALFTDPRWPEPWPPMRVERRNALALRLALVAAGEFDGMIALGPKHDWDLAAGALIATEAGAAVSDRFGERLGFNTARATSRSLVCAAPRLHALLLARLQPLDLPD